MNGASAINCWRPVPNPTYMLQFRPTFERLSTLVDKARTVKKPRCLNPTCRARTSLWLAGRRRRPGLALRMDHGSQYLSDHFLKQIRYWGIHPSFGVVEEPETNGVAERWNRTLKEQAIHGRIFQNLEAVRAAVADFVERYNQTWRLEKLGYQTPIEAREEYELRQAA